jgi:hypothetical protein
MNPALTELHATARRNQLLADAERRHGARQARVQRRTRAAQMSTLTALASSLSRTRRRRLVEAYVA